MKTKTLLLFTALLASSSIMAAPPEYCKDLFKKGFFSKHIPQHYIEQYVEQVRLPEELEPYVKEGKMSKRQATGFVMCVHDAARDCNTFPMEERQAEIEKKIKQLPEPQQLEVMRKETRKILDDYSAWTRDIEDRCAVREGIDPVHFASDALKE